MARKGQVMHFEMSDTALRARIEKQHVATGCGSLEKVLLRLLETQEEQDRWLLESQEAIRAKIQRGLDQLDRGEGIPGERIDIYLAAQKNNPE
jgi:hypothetical protein